MNLPEHDEKRDTIIDDFYEAVDDLLTKIASTDDTTILTPLVTQLTRECESFLRSIGGNKNPVEIPAYLTKANAHEVYEVDSLIEWIIDPELFGLACPHEVRVKATRARDARDRLREAYRKHDRARSASD